MKNLLAVPILILTFCVISFAQTNQDAPCPKISVLGPAEIPMSGDIVNFTVKIESAADKLNLLFNWQFSGDEIVEGQGTKQIKVLLGEICNKNYTATLEISGLPKNCQNTYSETLSVSCCFINPIQIDEFSIPATQILKAKLNNLTTELEKNPSAQIYIIERFEKKNLPKTVERKNQKTIDYLKKSGMDVSRFTLINGYSDKNLTQIFLVPAGATAPTCDDCEDIKPK